MIRQCWIDEGNDARGDLHSMFGITDPIFSVRDPRVTRSYLDGQKAKGYAPGLYLCSQGEGWPSHHDLSGRAWADWAYNEVQVRIAPGTSGSYPKVHLNCETSDAVWLVTMLKRWRARSPKRETSLLIEGRKAGIFSPDQVTAINSLGVYVCIELCAGDMTPHPEGFATLPMLRAGFDPLWLYGVYDAKNLPYDWQGVAFTQGRLPQ